MALIKQNHKSLLYSCNNLFETMCLRNRDPYGKSDPIAAKAADLIIRNRIK